MNCCEGPGSTVTASSKSTSTFTEPLALAVTAKVLGMSLKATETVAPAVIDLTGSTQGLTLSPPAHCTSPATSQPEKVQSASATAVSVAEASTLTAKPCEEPGLIVTAPASPILTATEPLVPATTVRVLGARKVAETVASAVTEPIGSAQMLGSRPAGARQPLRRQHPASEGVAGGRGGRQRRHGQDAEGEALRGIRGDCIHDDFVDFGDHLAEAVGDDRPRWSERPRSWLRPPRWR